jgi:hypothetical protein
MTAPLRRARVSGRRPPPSSSVSAPESPYGLTSHGRSQDRSVDGADCPVYRYPVHLIMIRGFRHRGLKRLYECGDQSRVGAGLADRVALALADLDDAQKPSDLDLPGYRPPR